MEQATNLDSESPSSTGRSIGSVSSSNSISAKYLTADEGSCSESESDNETFCDLETDAVDRESYRIRPVPERIDVTEQTPLLIDSISYRNVTDEKPSKWTIVKQKAKKFKPIFLFLWCIVFAGLFVSSPENQHTEKLVCVSTNLEQEFDIPEKSKIVRVTVKGPFTENDIANSSNFLSVGLAMPSGYLSSTENNKELYVNVHTSQEERNQSIISKTMSFEVPKQPNLNTSASMFLRLKLFSKEDYNLAVSITHNFETMTETTQVVLAFLILVCVYILIIFELVHRATAAMLGGLAALSILSFLNKRPTLETVLMWIEWETLSLLFGMMIVVAIFAETGFFDYIALKAYKISRGRVWGLVTLLCVFTGVISAVLDNVTTILLLTPVTIRLCQVLNLDPTYVLIAEVIFSNIGGTATAIGDPPNVLLATHKDILSSGVTFSDFTKHLLPGIFVCFIAGYAGLRLLYLRVSLENPDSPQLAELKREVEIWRRTADRVPHVSPEEKTVKLLLLQKILRLETTVRNMEHRQTREQAFKQNLRELENKYKITDFPLLVKSGFVISIVVALFFLQSFIEQLQFAIGWIAVLGALALILLAHIENLEELMEKVEWTTLVFFAGLFVLMEALKELGLFDFLSGATCSAIEKFDESNRLTVAIIAIIWISAIASSFVDNIPFTTAMVNSLLPAFLMIPSSPPSIYSLFQFYLSLTQSISLFNDTQFSSINIKFIPSLLALFPLYKDTRFPSLNIKFISILLALYFLFIKIPIAIKLHSSETAGLPLEPLIWALAMGACLGGNGTLIGASANVVCAGLSEQYGYPISFMKLTKIGFPMMLLTVTVAMVYLLICHVVIGWSN